MHRVVAFAAGLIFAAGPGAAWAAPAQTNTCSCDDPSGCTTVDGIAILYARRDMVRKSLRDLGARPIAEDNARIVDIYDAPRSKQYTKILAFYDDERQLADLEFEYPDSELESFLKDPDGPLPGAVFEGQRGDFSRGKNSRKTWLTQGGVEVTLFRRQDQEEDGFFLSFEAPAVRSRLDARLKNKHSSASSSSGGSPGVEQAGDAKPTSGAMNASAAPVAQGFSINPLQGVLTFRADEPVLLGKKVLRTSFCGTTTDPKTGFSPATTDEEFYAVSGFPKPRDQVDAEFEKGGSLLIKLGVRDQDGDTYQFTDVKQGAITPASARGDCRRRKVTVAFERTDSRLCVSANIADQSLHSILDQLVKTTGITLEHVDLLPNEAKLSLGGEMNAHWLLTYMADFADVEVIKIDDTHFAFHKPVSKDFKSAAPK